MSLFTTSYQKNIKQKTPLRLFLSLFILSLLFAFSLARKPAPDIKVGSFVTLNDDSAWPSKRAVLTPVMTRDVMSPEERKRWINLLIGAASVIFSPQVAAYAGAATTGCTVAAFLGYLNNWPTKTICVGAAILAGRDTYLKVGAHLQNNLRGYYNTLTSAGTIVEEVPLGHLVDAVARKRSGALMKRGDQSKIDILQGFHDYLLGRDDNYSFPGFKTLHSRDNWDQLSKSDLLDMLTRGEASFAGAANGTIDNLGHTLKIVPSKHFNKTSWVSIPHRVIEGSDTVKRQADSSCTGGDAVDIGSNRELYVCQPQDSSEGPSDMYYGAEFYGTEDDFELMDINTGASGEYSNNPDVEIAMNEAQNMLNNNVFAGCECGKVNGEWVYTGKIQATWSSGWDGVNDCYSANCGDQQGYLEFQEQVTS